MTPPGVSAATAMRRYQYLRNDHLSIVDIDPLDDVSEALTTGASLVEAGAIMSRSRPPAKPAPTKPTPVVRTAAVEGERV